jgi:hypothetical protein
MRNCSSNCRRFAPLRKRRLRPTTCGKAPRKKLATRRKARANQATTAKAEQQRRRKSPGRTKHAVKAEAVDVGQCSIKIVLGVLCHTRS